MQDERQAFRRWQSLQDNEEGKALRLGEDCLLLGTRRVGDADDGVWNVVVERIFDAARKNGEDAERLAVVAGWREAPFFTGAERAALSLAEAMTRMADCADPVPGEMWNEAARHYDEASLAALVVQIASINLWNRVNVATRQVAGAYEW